MSSVILPVEIAPGESIHQAARDATELATKLGVCVQFEFNGIELLAIPAEGPPESAVQDAAALLESEWYKRYHKQNSHAGRMDKRAEEYCERF